MKKNTMMRIASVLLIAVLMTTCVISGTFAKYVSTATGTGTAVIASWNVTLDDDDKPFTNSMSFDFLEAVYENADGTTADGDVKSGFIAPGTKGSFSFIVNNDSDVTAKFKIEHNAADQLADAGLTKIAFDANFSVTGGTKEIVDENPTGYVIVDAGGSATITFNWSWPFTSGEQFDNQETDVAKDTLQNRTITVTANIRAEQVD